jgi:hypothetical protein
MDCVLSEDDFGVFCLFCFWCQIRYTLTWNSCIVEEIIVEIDLQIEIGIEVDVDVDVGALIVWHGTWIWKNLLYLYPLP